MSEQRMILVKSTSPGGAHRMHGAGWVCIPVDPDEPRLIGPIGIEGLPETEGERREQYGYGGGLQRAAVLPAASGQRFP